MAEMTIAPVATHGFFVDGRWVEDGDIVEVRQVQEFEDFPPEVQKAAGNEPELRKQLERRKGK